MTILGACRRPGTPRARGRASQLAAASWMLILLCAPFFAQSQNVLVLLADDIGVPELAVYGEGPDPACTPVIDAMARHGVVFRNAYSNPVCSPTRATIQTGRHCFRTGMGDLVKESSSDPALDLAELTIPEALPAAYRSCYVGKWHLGNESSGGSCSTVFAGWGEFLGTERNIGGYWSWPRVDGCAESTSNHYATSAQVDDAIQWISAQDGPWVCMIGFTAAHWPFHKPPESLVWCQDLAGGDARRNYRAMIEAMDFEIGRLLSALGSELAETTVVFLGDNGTPGVVVQDGVPPRQSKGQVYEGGVNVPLIVAGMNVAAPGRYEDALVNTTDVFATVMELVGSSATARDSISVVPYLFVPGLPSARKHAFVEVFTPAGFAPTWFRRGIRDDRYKLVRESGKLDELYDLHVDPLELDDLLLDPTPREFARYMQLARAMQGLLRS